MSGLTKLTRIVAVMTVVLALTGIAHAACLSDDVVAKLVAGYPTTPVTGIPANLSLDDAYCTQAKYVALLEQKMGPPVGNPVNIDSDSRTKRRFDRYSRRVWPGAIATTHQ